ncbi:MAG: hypothetical protein K9J16_14890 [Melioribacteraceae bacterium]|nr:hypothetical protein [Melioribacteraceae bacterium]MCF8356249.1 hypothetical protein [Melioribacteraceae bacterium]MCF8395431.1 hypothetical protein [Melioribacteraceae bacterium]MCF8420765.1 hypothetical protein [Melioribacteraceae bacterium]
MDKSYIQNLRYKLQKRYRKLNSAETEYFPIALSQFWKYLMSYPVYVGILDYLEKRSSKSIKDAKKILNGEDVLFGEDENESVNLAYLVIKKSLELNDPNIYFQMSMAYSNVGKASEALEFWKDIFLEPLYEFIDEELDDQKAILALLNRYKRKCEWFQKEKLYRLWEENTLKGEKILAKDLYEYLYDQGIDFFIEPSSGSGEVDLISAQEGDDPILADVKIFNPNKSKDKSYICNGFNQVYTYTLDYNEFSGYLVIFKTCEEDLKFSLANKELSTPFVLHNNKAIFLITIDIFPNPKSASKRGTLKTIEITEKDLIKIIE